MDRNTIAVELARLGIWIHTFVPGLPLSFLDHSLVVGDSLTGIGTLDEIVDALTHGRDKSARLYVTDYLAPFLAKAQPALAKLATIEEADRSEIATSRDLHRQALDAVQPIRDLCDLLAHSRIATSAMLPDRITEATIEQSEWLGDARRETATLGSLHFPVVFPEVFLRDDRSGFDCILGNPPWQEVKFEELEFWNTRFPGMKVMPEADRVARIAELRNKRPDLADTADQQRDKEKLLSTALHAGPYPGMGEGDADVYKAFAWRFLAVIRAQGHIGVVLPRGIYTAKGTTEWRKAALCSSRSDIYTLRNVNELVFTDVNEGYKITFTTIQVGLDDETARDSEVRVFGNVTNPNEYSSARASGGVALDWNALAANDPECIIPDLGTSEELGLFERLISHEAFGGNGRTDAGFPHRELDATKARNDGYFHAAGDPVRNHLNLGHFRFDRTAGQFAFCNMRDVCDYLYDFRRRTHTRSDSAFRQRPAEWAEDNMTHPIHNARVAYRAIIHSGNRRKLWFALVPSETPLTNSAPYLVFPDDNVLPQAWVLACMNSSTVDWIGHLRITLNLNYFILNTLPMPEFVPENILHVRACELAAYLAVSDSTEFDGTDWESLADRVMGNLSAEDAFAELDAITSVNYGVDDNELSLIWDGENPTRPALASISDWRARIGGGLPV